MRLAGVFNYSEAALPGDSEDFSHRRWVAVEMNGHYGARSGADYVPQEGRIEVLGVRQNVHENRRGAGHADCADGRGRRVRHRYYLVAWPDFQRFQCKKYRVSTGVNTDYFSHIKITRKGSLELCQLRAQNEPAAFENPPDGALNRLTVPMVLFGKCEKWDHGDRLTAQRAHTQERFCNP